MSTKRRRVTAINADRQQPYLAAWTPLCSARRWSRPHRATCLAERPVAVDPVLGLGRSDPPTYHRRSPAGDLARSPAAAFAEATTRPLLEGTTPPGRRTWPRCPSRAPGSQCAAPSPTPRPQPAKSSHGTDGSGHASRPSSDHQPKSGGGARGGRRSRPSRRLQRGRFDKIMSAIGLHHCIKKSMI